MTRWYILGKDHRVVRCRDLLTWGMWMEDHLRRRVARDKLGDDVSVSTVFLGMDHRHWGKGPPIVFETMIFGGPLDGEQWRYASWDDAETGHAAAVRKVKAANARPGARSTARMKKDAAT